MDFDVTDCNAVYERKGDSPEDIKQTMHPRKFQKVKRNKEATRRTVPIEETTSKALVYQCDGLGYDWSDQAKEGPTNFALMAYTSLGSSSFSSSDPESRLNVVAYKVGLESVEARLDVYKKNEAIFEVDIKILKLDVMLRDNAITELRKKFEKAKKERDDLKLTLEKFEKESVKKVEEEAKYLRKNSQSPRGNKRNWNNLMTQKLGSDFEFKNKACFVCGSFNHLIKDCDFYEKKMVEKPIWNNARRVNHQNSQKITHPHPKRNFVPRAVLMKSGLKTLNTARQNSSRAAVSVNTARPINTALPKTNSELCKASIKWQSTARIMKKLMVDLLPLVETQRSKIQMTIQKDDEYVGAKADMTNLDSHIPVRPIPTTRIHKDHPLSQIIGDIMNTTSNQKNYRNKTAQKNPKRFQVNPKVSHLHAVKRIFRYLKGQPKLGLWYPKDSPFDLVHICDRDNVEQVLDSKSQQEDVNSYSLIDFP
ncbi:hypothetical protein Tco_1336077 [Tanacetum coccineum]